VSVPTGRPSAPSTLADVLAAFRAGAASTADLAVATGLDRELVAVALDQLVGLGLVTRSAVSSGCPEGGCGGCPAPTGQGCSTPGTPRRGGVVTLTLSPRPT
jgi:hypothetical protein